MARSNARLEVSGAGKTEDGLVQYNEEVNKLGDDLRELYETIRVNVDEEEQWKVFDFAEDFFMEELEIGDYINDINSYHLHMFDKHDVTTKKFDAIVEKAGKVDANYAAQIEGYCSLLGEYGKKFETVCAMLALDLIGVIPVIGALKYSNEIGTLFKNADKVSVVARSTDDAGVLAKHADDIQGLSAIEIAEKYALPQTPDKIVYPKIPSDVPLEISIVGPQEAWGTLGGDAQYAIKEVLLDDDWFADIHDLK